MGQLHEETSEMNLLSGFCLVTGSKRNVITQYPSLSKIFFQNNKMIKWWHSPETFWYFSADKFISPAFRFPHALFLFISALSLFASARKTIAALLRGAQRWRNATLSLYSFPGCFRFRDSFLTSRAAGFHACASHLVIDIFLRVPAAAERRCSFRALQPSPCGGFWLAAWLRTGLWPAWPWWSHMGPAAGSNSHGGLRPYSSSRDLFPVQPTPRYHVPQQSGAGVRSDATAVKQRVGLKNVDLCFEWELLGLNVFALLMSKETET